MANLIVTRSGYPTGWSASDVSAALTAGGYTLNAMYGGNGDGLWYFDVDAAEGSRGDVESIIDSRYAVRSGAPIPSTLPNTYPLQNSDTVSFASGDVVTLDRFTARSFRSTALIADTGLILVVAQNIDGSDTVAPGEWGLCSMPGAYCPKILCTTDPVGVGNYLWASGTAKQAKDTGVDRLYPAPNGAFAVAVTSKDAGATGYVEGILEAHTVAGIDPQKDPATVANTIVETNLYTFQGIRLLTNGLTKFRVALDELKNAAGTGTLRVKYGSTTILTITVPDTASSALH
ncbi:MAG TPA: hypothetical protein VIV12_21125, partial [Streptosporangiaceae bacterium]